MPRLDHSDMGPIALDATFTLKPNLRLEILNDVGFLFGELERYVLPDKRMQRILALLDGRKTVHEMVIAAADFSPEPYTLYVLSHCLSRNYIVRSRAQKAETGAFWHAAGLDPTEVEQALSETAISVISLCEPTIAERAVAALRSEGVRFDQSYNTIVVVTDDYLRPELMQICRAAKARQQSVFVLCPLGARPLIGPFIHPSTGPCWQCVDFWIRRNRPVEELIRRTLRQSPRVGWPHAAIDASTTSACAIGAMSLIRALASPVGNVCSRILAVDFGSNSLSVHSVVARPQCGGCGDPELVRLQGERAVELKDSLAGSCTDGGYRVQDADSTVAQYVHLVSPIAGAVSFLGPLECTGNTGAVFVSGYLTCPSDGVPRTNTFDKFCAGKGRTMSQAKASALCEALERFSGTFQGDEARVRSSRAALGVEAITPNSLLQFSQSQIRARDGKLRAQTLSLRVPAPLHDDTEIDWTPGWSLTMSARRFLPFTYCYSNAPAECGVEFCRPCGNGVAAGTCMEEAILQGVLELVERDAASIWWYNMVVRPAVDLASFSDPFFQTTLAEYASIGWELWALDLTHDLQIAAVVAVAYQRATDAFCVGFGCHLNATLAVQRALTEVNQLLQLRRRQGISVPTSAEERIYLFPCVTTAARRMADLPSSSHQGFRRDLAHSIERLNEARLELIVVDKTRPDIGLNVAHVAVPGLRHIWPRFGPGRLYSVPPALGWLPRALTENQLNQVPLLL